MKTVIQILLKYKEWLIVAILALTVWGMTSKISKLKADNERLTQNVEYYLNANNGAVEENRVLRLTVDDFSSSNDLLVQRVDSVLKRLKISEKALQSAVTANQRIEVSKNDTIRVVDNGEGFSFTKEFRFNDQTISTVYYEHYVDSLKADSIRNDLYITNEPTLLIYSKREYKNKKNFFKRLFTLDWKKRTTTNYTLVNSNDELKTDDMRVINIESK